MTDVPPHLERAEPRIVGMRDASLAGWFNGDAGELTPGFPIDPEDVVVDVGCGEGGFATFCGRRGAHVVLVDLDPEKVRVAAEALAGTDARKVEHQVGDSAALPLADGMATRVICTEVLEHVDDPVAVMRELARIAAPGALLLVTVPAAASERVQKRLAYPAYFEKPNHIRIIEPAELDALVEGAGLTIERRAADGFYWSVYLAMLWQTGAGLAGDHPTLRRWAKTWLRITEGRDGLKIKAALDAALPKRQIVVARKGG